MAEKHLVLLESEDGVSIEDVLRKNGIKLLENELIPNGAMMKVADFFANELRREYLLDYEWYQSPDRGEKSAILEVTEETYKMQES